jgi:predicted glycosyltransferase
MVDMNGPAELDVDASERRAAHVRSRSPRFVFSSHDGYGLGHVRRNTLIARAILAIDPDAHVTVVTGVRVKPSWLTDHAIDVVQVPPLLKGIDGGYRHASLPFEAAIAERAELFARTVAMTQPDVVVVDRHPFGVAGELRRGLDLARSQGGRAVLGLRDVLDEPATVRAELAGDGWRGVTDTFDEVLVYGERVLCDHEVEYGLPTAVRYCGWVVEAAPASARDPRLLAVTAGGGGDGAEVFRLGIDLVKLLPEHHAVIVAGPYADRLPALGDLDEATRQRIELRAEQPGCGELFAAAGAVVQMAGYNSTFESLAAGVRPVLVPRRSPRREQAIRAARLAAMGVADIVDEGAPADEVAWLVRRPRQLSPMQLADAGVRLDGARRVAQQLLDMAKVGAS